MTMLAGMVIRYGMLVQHIPTPSPHPSSSVFRAQLAMRRSWSLVSDAGERRIARLKEQAASRPSDVEAQAVFLRALGEFEPAEVVRSVESGRLPASDAIATEYLRALSRTNGLRADKLPHVLAAIGSKSPAMVEGGKAFGAARTAMMSSVPTALNQGQSHSALKESVAVASSMPAILGGPRAAPLQVALTEPSLQAQLWKLVRVLGTTFLLLGFLGVLLEERGGGGMARIKMDAEPEPESSNPVMFEDVAGATEAKEELQEIVEYLKNPELFTRLGGKVPKGCLLVGPPGTGKTLLAKAVAGEAERPFFYASGSSFEELYVGVGAKRVRELFAAAKKNSPCIVFIDEIDAMGAKRSPRDASYVKLAFFELLQALDGFRSNDNIIVVAATNNPESLDPALVRPGRFDRHITVPNPDVQGRREILGVHTKEKVPLAGDVDLDIIARGTPGFSGADLANLVNSAAVKAAIDQEEAVAMSHFEFARDKILMGAERKSAEISETTRRLTSYHEGGHALCALHTKGALPVHKATIVPRGASLGMVAQLPERDQTSMSRHQMLAKLVVCMGGRAAEELVLGKDFVTSGAQSDFAQATRLAEAMVTQFGLSPSGSLGHMVYNRETESPETRNLIEREMKSLLDTAYESAMSLLRLHEAELHNLSRALLDRETLTGEEVRLASRGMLSDLSHSLEFADSSLGASVPSSIQGTHSDDVLGAPSVSSKQIPYERKFQIKGES